MNVAELLYAFYLITALNAGYYLLFLTGLLRYRKQPSSNNLPPVSIIIAAHNEEANLKLLIPVLLQQSHHDFEIIIVLDRTDDGSVSLLESYSISDQRITFHRIDEVPEGFNPKKYALREGIAFAKNEHLIFTDADCFPQSEHWINEMVSKLVTKNAGAVLGFSQYLKRPGFLNYFIRYETLFTGIQYLAMALWGKPFMGVGRNLAYRKSEFYNHKGFSGIEGIMGGDDDLLIQRFRNNTKINVCLEADSLVLSQPKTSWKQFIKQKKRHMNAGKYYHIADKIFLGLFNLSTLGWWALFLLLLFQNNQSYQIFIALSIRLFIQYVTFAKASYTLGNNFNWWAVAVLDLIFVIFYYFTGLWTLVSRTKQWI